MQNPYAKYKQQPLVQTVDHLIKQQVDHIALGHGHYGLLFIFCIWILHSHYSFIMMRTAG